ncbi:MAG: hypothetical protein R3B70_06535 [Polyangiaceae bacterium]
MRILLLSAVLAATSLLGCATQTTTTGTGGAGGTGGSGGTTTTTDPGGAGGTGGAEGGTGGMGGTGGGTTTSTSSTTEDLCGNGVKDDGEQCDGKDLGGKTCASIGFSGGQLQCNSFCAIVASGCTPPENCNNAEDDDQDGLFDCLDPDCADKPTCTDSCAEPKIVTLPSFTFSDTTGRPAMLSSSCSPASGSEVVFQLTATETVDMTINVWSFNGTDFTLSVRTACADDASEIACVNKVGPFDFQAETLLVPLVKDQTYFVVVDGTGANDFGGFQIDMQVPLPEFDFQCDNQFDDDFDGYLDCDDPSDCQSSTYCQPGNQPPGAQCFSNTECAATGNDPICLGLNQGFVDGYCSEFCDLANPVCAGDGICADPIDVTGKPVSVNGICFDACTTNGDCRPGYECVDRGLAQNVCIVAPEKSCSDNMDNDADGLYDCGDPDCQGTPACVPGAKAAGQPCVQNTECFANANDPICLTSAFFGFPGGYCSQFCDPAANDCSLGSICIQGIVFQLDAPLCMDTCNQQADCLPGYFCQDFGFPQKICTP